MCSFFFLFKFYSDVFSFFIIFLRNILFHLETQEELEESLKALVSQNNDLVELLQKANIKVPHFVGPKFVSFIVAVHDTDRSDENNKVVNKPLTINQSNEINKNQPQTKWNVNHDPVQVKIDLNGTKSVHNSSKTRSDLESHPKTHLNLLPELKEVKSFGSVDLIPVNNDLSRSELKVHEKPVKNSVEITPLVNNQNEKIPTHAEIAVDDSSKQKESTTNIQGLTVLIFECSHLV